MFNITQSGNAINISSPDVTFHITGSFVSGTSFKIANIEAEGYGWEVTCSGTTANVKLLPRWILRNSYQSAYPDMVWVSLEYTAPKNASGIIGTATKIHENDGAISGAQIEPGSIVRNGDYVYFYYRAHDDVPTELQIMEYQISTGVKRYISVAIYTADSYSIATGYTEFISIIEGRKLLVGMAGLDSTESPLYYHVYIVDFDANTCTETLTFLLYDGNIERYLNNSAVIKDDTGDIHLIVSCEYRDYDDPYISGWSIYHKNYTDNTAWTETKYIRDFGTDDHIHKMYDYVISNNRYFCVFCSYHKGSGRGGYLIFSYDILTEILSQTHGGDVANYVFASYIAMEDATNHKIYIVMKMGSGAIYSIYEFDPVTCILGSDIVDFDASNFAYMSASNTHLYDWYVDDNIYRTSDQWWECNFTRPPKILNVSMLMDNNGIIWFMDGSYLKAINLTGAPLFGIDTGIPSTNIGIIHIGNTFVLTVYDEVNWTHVDYYLVK